MSPLGAGFLRAEQLGQMEPFYPLQVLVCDECFLVQVAPIVDGYGDRIITGQSHAASASESWLAHMRRYRDRAIEEFRLTPAHKVVEVSGGSNDGHLLHYFRECGIPAVGIDARALRDEVVRADLVVANNVLAEVHDLNDFVAGLKVLMAPRGVMTLEFPHLMRLIADNQFDTIHHDRFSYFSLLAAMHLLANNGLTVYDVDELDTHGGSLRVFACHSEDPLRPITPRVDTLVAREREAGLDRLDYYAAVVDRVRETKHQLLDFLITAKRDGKRIAGYGAPRRGSPFLYYCGICADLLDYIADPDAEAQGRFLRGVHIPIRSPDAITETKPDYVLLFDRDWQREIIPRLDYIRSWGGRCVIPFPEVDMVA
jgi:hypothetical protein